MRSFKGTINIYMEYSQSFILWMVLYFFSDVKSQYALSFSVFQNTSHGETNFLSKQLYFQSSIDYTEIRAAAWSSYYIAKFFQNTYLSGAATSSL